MNVSSIEQSVDTITTSLLVSAQASDQGAWERIVHVYSPLVFRWCRQKDLSNADASDVGQEVFLAVARKLGDFHRDQPDDTFRGWLRTITNNKIKDFWRRTNKAPNGEGGSDVQAKLNQVPFDDDRATDAEDTKVIYRRIIELIQGEYSEKDWQAFSAVVIEGRQAGDVADELNITRNQVYLAKSRILQRIREEFGDPA